MTDAVLKVIEATTGASNLGAITYTDAQGNVVKASKTALADVNGNQIGISGAPLVSTISGALPAGTNAIGIVTANAGTGTFAVADVAGVAPGATAAPTKALVVSGKTADTTPAYQPLPLAAGGGSVPTSQAGAWDIRNVTGAVSLPTGAATAALQSNVQSAAGTASATAMTVQGNANGVPLPVTVGNFPATQAVSGSVSVGNFPATQAISAASLPLPAGAATDTTVAGITTSLGTDGATPPSIPGTGVRGWLRSIYDKLAGTLTVGGTVALGAGSANVGSITNVTGTVSLPTGAATSALQAGVQSAAGTPNATAVTVQGNAGGVPMPVSGSVSVTGTAAVSGTVTANQGAAGASAWPVTVGNTVAVSGSVTANAGTGTFNVAGTVTANAGSGTFGTNIAQYNGAAVGAANPVHETPVVGGAVVSAANPMPAAIIDGGAAVGINNPLHVTIDRAAKLITAISAANAAVTLTIPAPPAGQFIYLTYLRIRRHNGATATTAGAATTTSSTNLNSFAVTQDGAAVPAQSGVTDFEFEFGTPIKSDAAATATTITAPANGATLTTRITAAYYYAP